MDKLLDIPDHSEFNDYPPDAYLDKLNELPDPSEFDNYPGEEYLDKLIEGSGIEPGSLT